MRKLDFSVLDSIIADHLGPRTRWRRATGDDVTPMSVTIADAMQDLQQDIAVYWVDGGLPENFSLPGFDPALIVFSTRFVEFQATLFRLIRNAGYLSLELLSAVSESLSLQIAAALVLEGGDPATGSYLMMKSQIAGHGVYIAPSTIGALELETKNEAYMAVWFYALLHEIGHVFAAESGSDFINRTFLIKSIQDALDDASVPADLAEQLNWQLESRGLRHSLHPEQIEEEIAADLFAIQSLWRSTVTVMERDGRGAEFRPGKLAISIYQIYNVLVLLNNCAYSARQATYLASLIDEPWVHVSYHVRLNYVLQGLAMLLAGDEDVDAVRTWHSDLVEMTTLYSDVLAAIESGQTRAQKQILYPAERDQSLEFLPAEAARTQVSGVREFVATADALDIKHPDVEYLRSHLEGNQGKVDQYVFFVLWVILPNGSKSPFALRGKYGNFIFAFAARDAIYTRFRDQSAALLPQGGRLEETIIVTNHVWQVAIICAQAMPADIQDQTSVLIQGSSLFNRVIRELADGSIWPTRDSG